MGNAVRWFFVFVVAVPMGQVFADDDHERARRLHESGVIVPLEKVVEKVRATYPDSKVLEAELKDKKQGLTYEIEIVDQTGVVRELYFNARTGEFLRIKQE